VLIENDSPILPEHVPNYNARTGFQFVRWYKETGPGEWAPYHPAGHTVTADVTFRAHFDLLFHPVTFVVGEGGAATSPRVEQIRDGTAIGEVHLAPPEIIPITEALPGWQFVGWEPQDPLGIYPNGAMTFTAVFEKIPDLSVVFDNDSLVIAEDGSGTIDVNVIGIGRLNPVGNYRLEITRTLDGSSQRIFEDVTEVVAVAFCAETTRITARIVSWPDTGVVHVTATWMRPS